MAHPGYTRRQEFTCTLEELNTYSSVILYANEVLYVKQANGLYDILIGDGVTPVGELQYVIRYSEIEGFKDAANNAANLANVASTRAAEAATAAEASAAAVAEKLDQLDLPLYAIDGKLNIEFEEES